MSEKNVLRNSLLGGYRKSDVIEYMDTVLDNSEKKVMELEERISALTKKNQELSVREQRAAKQVLENKEDAVADKNDQTIFSQLPFESTSVNKSTSVNNQGTVSIRQQMKLPEGSYQILEGNRMIHIPEPMPTYLTKEKLAPSEPFTKISAQASDVPAVQKKSESQHSNKTYTSSVMTGKEGFQFTATKESEEENPNRGSRVVDDKLDRALEHSLMARVNELTAELESERQQKQALALKLEACNDVKPDNNLEYSLIARVNELTAELERERQEKQTLASKLEFCNDLLLQLYKK